MLGFCMLSMNYTSVFGENYPSLTGKANTFVSSYFISVSAQPLTTAVIAVAATVRT